VKEALDAGNSKEAVMVAELEVSRQELQALHQKLAHMQQDYSTLAASGVCLSVCTDEGGFRVEATGVCLSV